MLNRTTTIPIIGWALALAAAAAAQPAQPEEAALRADLESRLAGVAARIPALATAAAAAHMSAAVVAASLFQADVAGHRPIQTEPVVGSPLAFRESAQPEDGERALRAEVEEFLTDIEARIETMSAQRECAPRVNLLGLVQTFRADLERSPLSDIEVRRLMKGVVELDNLVRLYDFSLNDTCEIYNEAERLSGEFTRVRTEAEAHLIRSAASIQSRLPSSAAELRSMLSLSNSCYRPSAHRNATMLKVYKAGSDARSTPFQAMKKFVHVANDGVIRARYRGRRGRDSVRWYDPFTGGWFGVRNHTYLFASTYSAGFEFRLCVKRKGLRSEGSMLKSGKDYFSLTDLPQSPTVADVGIGVLVRSARRFAAGWCAKTVRSSALLARVFEANTPPSEDSARVYRSAARAMRDEVESLSVTDASVADLCNGRDVSLRALARPAVEMADLSSPEAAIEYDLFHKARREAELSLGQHARNILEAYLLGK